MIPKRLAPYVLSVSAFILVVSGLFACNVSDSQGRNLLSVNLSDSLAKHDSIRIEVKVGGATVFDTLLEKSRGDYDPISEGKFKAILDLGDDPPKTYDIVITTYSGGSSANYRMQVTPAGVTSPQRTDTPLVVHVKPQSVSIPTTNPLTLAVNGSAVKLEAVVMPSGAGQEVLWSTSDESVAKIGAGGLLTPGKAGDAKITVRVKADPSLSAQLDVKVINPPKAVGITLDPPRAVLYVGGQTLQLAAAVLIEGGTAGMAEFSSSDTGIAKVGPSGLVTAVDTGKAVLTARPLGDSLLSVTCSVTVRKDVPRLEVPGDRKAKAGDTLGFPIKVTQEYGGVAALSWDLDGDGKWDSTVTDSSAAPSRVYDGADSVVIVRFHVRDTEGNSAEVSRRVVVGAGIILVDITRPSGRDTLVSATPFRVVYTVDGVEKTKDVDLKEGANPVVISESNAEGSGRDSVTITLDTRPPVVDISAPAGGLVTRESSVAVVWTVDGTPQAKANSENLIGKQGSILITREAFDAAGNRGFDTVTIHRDTIPPQPPAFTSATTLSPSKLVRPTWAWAGGGGGNGTFLYVFTGQAEVRSTETSFTPPADLPDGEYVLVVRELDAAGNQSTAATRTIRVQTKGPLVRITSPAEDALTAAAAIPVSWTVDGVAQTTQTSENLRGKQGSIAIIRSATDPIGNVGSDTVYITRDTVAPARPAFSARPPDIINSAHNAAIQWTWTRTGPATDSFLVSINGGAASKQAGTSHTLSSPGNQSYIIKVEETDLAGNVSLPLLDTILVDRLAPGTPTLSGAAYTDAFPSFTWTSVEANASYQYRLMRSGSATPVMSGTTAQLAFPPTGTTPPAAVEGVFQLFVRAVNAAGNEGPEANRSTTVDLTDPSVAITGPAVPGRATSVDPTITGTASDNNGLASFTYAVQGGGSGNVAHTGGNWTLASLAVPVGSRTVTVTATDLAGNTASAGITITRVNNVVFVRKTATGNNSGTSWENAYKELWSVATPDKNYLAGTQVWVAKGGYSNHPDSATLEFNRDLELYGGFHENGSGASLAARDVSIHETKLLKTMLITDDYKPNQIQNFILDGFVAENSNYLMSVNVTGTAQIKNCRLINFQREAIAVNRGLAQVSNSQLSQGSNLEYAAIGVYFAGRAEITQTSITNNDGTGYGSAVHIYGGHATIRNCIITGNRTLSYDPESEQYLLVPSQITFIGGSLTIGNTVITGGVGGIDQSGSINDEGGNRAP